MGHAMGEGVGLAGSGAGDHQQRRTWARSGCAMLDGPPLLWIEAFEVGGCGWHGTIVLVKNQTPRFPPPSPDPKSQKGQMLKRKNIGFA
jgi:hypothetical protein